MITKDLVKVMNAIGLTEVWEARIEQLDLLADGLDSRMAGEAYLRSVTVDEHRESVLNMPALDDEEQGGRFLKEPREAGQTRHT
jgi:hypothetical protein